MEFGTPFLNMQLCDSEHRLTIRSSKLENKYEHSYQFYRPWLMQSMAMRNLNRSKHGLRTPNEGIHKSKISEKLGRCGRQNMLPPYLEIRIEFLAVQ